MKNKSVFFVLSVLVLISFVSCSTLKSSSGDNGTENKMWKEESVIHAGYTDLGNYVIDLSDYSDPSIVEKGIALVNARYDHGDITRVGCTAMITRNSNGEVVVGRNMDVEISQDPAYVYTTSYGKYRNFCVSYVPGVYKHYEDVLKQETIDENFYSMVPYLATDCFNEKGLYVESNMRTSYSELSNYGLHSVHGEVAREDGTLWKDLRVCTMSLPQIVTQNCATVAEAVEFIKNSYDWYTIGLPTIPHYDGWNMCFIVGDATGEYGLIEIAQDEVHYIPYQFGQANFYITPKWGVLDHSGSGYGRLSRVSDIIKSVESLDDAMNAMKAIMWRNETLWIGESERADSSTNPNPYNQVIFKDDEGNKQLDWRSDYVQLWPVLDDGRMIVDAAVYGNACKSTYDPKIKKYYDDAISRGTLVVDDNSMLFEVNGKKLTLTELREKYEEYEEYGAYPELQKQLLPYYNEYFRLLNNQNSYWCHDDHNFEALKAAAYEMLHTRYDAEGNYDSSAMSKYEKLRMYYGYGVEKNETPLRNDASIWTTSLNIGVNCAEKTIKVRFWENDEVVYRYQF